MTRNSKIQKKKNITPFSKRLVLFHYFLDLLGYDCFEDLANYINHPENEGLDSENTSKFCSALINSLSFRSAKIDEELLLYYDQNINRHTASISEKRTEPIKWKYFQYLSLLFSEIYLDRYMSDKDSFLADLNKYLKSYNLNKLAPEAHLEWYSLDDIRKICLWCATSAGKTLLMHINLKQFLHYLDKYRKENEINRILLITPNEGLSKQHKEEFDLSDIQAVNFNKSQTGGLLHGHLVEIIEVTKLRENEGDKTIAVDSFESNNLILVDEGHRGSSGDDWMKTRRQLSKNGFAFEYSATFGQAVSGKEALEQEYAKSILFDYSYKYFYLDGFGKDYKILNLKEDDDENIRSLYLTACIMTFYQQKLVYSNSDVSIKKFQIENPLWVFVGSSVNAVRTENKRKVSDVIDILLFLADFVSPHNKEQNIKKIEKLIKAGLQEKDGRNIFANAFPGLVENIFDPQQIYINILKTVFNSSHPAALHIEELRGTDGELSLKLGDNEPFGVINVGDSSELKKLCAEHNEFITSEKNFTGSLFRSINEKDSNTNILIGSKKFTEGWNSWRVSTMGLMNIGTTEGAQIIQLFGRGVRLKGYEFTLKRHRHLKHLNIKYDSNIALLETLNIFGIRADYMKQFQEYLEKEGVPTPDSHEEIILPVIKNLGKEKLKILSIKDGLDFKRNGEKPHLSLDKDLVRNKVILNYYPRLQFEKSKDILQDENWSKLDEVSLSSEHLAFIDYNKIFFELQRLKNDKTWFNFNVSKETIKEILEDKSWYILYIPREELIPDKFDKIFRWQDIAENLMRKYCEKFYLNAKEAWEAPHREYREIDINDPVFFDEYRLLIEKSQEQIIKQIYSIKELLEKNKIPELKVIEKFGAIEFIFFDKHLYQPLIYAEGEYITVKPVALNEGEKEFVLKLHNYCSKESEILKGKKLFLLRNLSRGKGLGFFEANNFHPDFILWLVEGQNQHISFVDPKGIRNMAIDDKKIEFHKKIKEIEVQLADTAVILNSFILSATPYKDLPNWLNKYSREEFEEKHVFFLEDLGYLDKLFLKVLQGQFCSAKA